MSERTKTIVPYAAFATGGGADDVARPVVLDRELGVVVRGELRGVVVLRGRTHVEVYILVAEHGAAVARRRVRVAHGDAAAADVGMDATATAAAVASFTATLAISIFFTLDALVGGFCTPPDFTDGDEEKCAIAARGRSLRLAGGLNALNPLFGDPM